MPNDTVEKVTVTETPVGTVQTQTTTKRGLSLNELFVSKTNQVIFTVVGIIDLLLLLRLGFLLLGANQVGIVSFILSLTQIFVAPFTGIFPSPSSGSSYLDMAALIAIIIYIVFGFILGFIIDLFSNKPE